MNSSLYVNYAFGQRDMPAEPTNSCSAFLKHLNLLLVYTPKADMEKNRGGEENTSQASIQNDEMWIFCQRCKGHGEKGADSGHGDGERIND